MVLVDLRSPEEFAKDHIPGAVNVPLFSGLQRSVVGYLFKQVSSDAALEKGQEFAAGRVDELVREVGQAAGWQPPGSDISAFVRQLTSGGMADMDVCCALSRSRGPMPTR
ncbi:MAG: rhodanese-like domain-containing protein [Planctomycetota bacterium]